MKYLIIIVLLVLFTVLSVKKISCPDCGGEMEGVDLHDGHTVYKCKNCGKEWI